ncbi:hypothetical protein HCD_01010 [Helicobacter cetorum MIT 99-5656]|uniref:Portal protein n=2 Tax=Helicobacter cetorum TaxID=138563 RepID=I0EQL5_HELCM|nr:hypothetical protein [Helicobacter cetorum]AFI05234.1 hypothetical protein HCD_01010 [Helicobacter cetorum MIT 99-5656]
MHITEQEAKTFFNDSAILYSTSNAYFSAQEKTALIIETWIKEEIEGEMVWNRYLWNDKAGIYKIEFKPFKNGLCPFVVSKLYIDEYNNYYGIFRDMKPLQDYINYAENRMGNMMGSFKAMFEEDAVANIDEFVETMSLDNAIVKVRPNALSQKKIEFMNNQADLSALSQKAEQKRQLLRILAGVNDESMGMAINRQSGVAIAQRQESGLMGLQTFLKASDDMDKLIYHLAIDFICYYFTKPEIYRIVDKKVGDRYFEANTNETNKIRPLQFDLIYKTQLKTESKDQKWGNWNELLKILAQIRPDIVPQLVPLILQDMDSPITADVLEVIQNSDALVAKNQEAQASRQQELQALEIEKLKAQILELESKANKYNAQGDLSKTTLQSEQINQALTIDSIQQGKVPETNLKTSDQTTWRKYPSSMNLDY